GAHVGVDHLSLRPLAGVEQEALLVPAQEIAVVIAVPGRDLRRGAQHDEFADRHALASTVEFEVRRRCIGPPARFADRAVAPGPATAACARGNAQRALQTAFLVSPLGQKARTEAPRGGFCRNALAGSTGTLYTGVSTATLPRSHGRRGRGDRRHRR